MLTAIAIITVATLAVSFFCSLWEAALYTISPARVEALRLQGHAGGERLHRLKSRIHEPIAAILILNTISHSAGALWAGALVGKAYGEGTILTLFSALFILAILLLSEIVPKTMGTRWANQLAPAMALVLEWLVILLKPLVKLCDLITHLIQRGHKVDLAETDVLAMAQLGARHGALRPEEARWVANALALDQITARDIMTPRTVVYSLPADMPIGDLKPDAEHWRHSRLPAVRNDRPDEVEGIVLRRDIFEALVDPEKHTLTIRDLMKDAFFVPEKMPGNELLSTFLKARRHLAIVVDEFGGMEGIVTLEDVLEELLGEEIVDESDLHADLQELARRRAKRRRELHRDSAV